MLLPVSIHYSFIRSLIMDPYFLPHGFNIFSSGYKSWKEEIAQAIPKLAEILFVRETLCLFSLFLPNNSITDHNHLISLYLAITYFSFKVLIVGQLVCVHLHQNIFH